MSAQSPADLPLGTAAPAFDLTGVDGARHTLASARGPNGLVVMFICNHCPYVQAVAAEDGPRCARSRRVGCRQHRDFEQRRGHVSRGFVREHEDVRRAARVRLSVHVRRIAGRRASVPCGEHAEFFGFDRDMKLAYHGRLDDSGRFAKKAAARALRSDVRRGRRSRRAGRAEYGDRLLDQVESRLIEKQVPRCARDEAKMQVPRCACMVFVRTHGECCESAGVEERCSVSAIMDGRTPESFPPHH